VQPVVTRCALSTARIPAFADGCPDVTPENLPRFAAALKPELSLMHIEPARPVFRAIGKQEPYPIPESCKPYLDANAMGFSLKTMLPLVFVKNADGVVLPEARIALKHLEADVLERIEQHARRIFNDESEFRHVVQPYGSFTDEYVSMRTGFWVRTPPGINTVLAPPVNQPGPLRIVTGSIETDWHHYKLFVVAEMPQFDGPVLFIEPDTVIAQIYFVSRVANETAEIMFSADDPGAEPGYAADWEQFGRELVAQGRATYGEGTGREFHPAYKILQRERRTKS